MPAPPGALIHFIGKIVRIEERIVDFAGSRQQVAYLLICRIEGSRAVFRMSAPFEGVSPGDFLSITARKVDAPEGSDPADEPDPGED